MKADEILEFWFGPTVETNEDLIQRMKRWFTGGPALDAEIISRFGESVEQALRGELDEWAQGARSCLALVLLLDQFPRHCYRNDPRSFDGAAKAEQLALLARDRGYRRELNALEESFLTVPLLHAENAALQQRGFACLVELAEKAPSVYKPFADAGVEQGQKYMAIVEQFGRFPHRNATLGREDTPEERAFLASWAENAPPRMAREAGLVLED